MSRRALRQRRQSAARGSGAREPTRAGPTDICMRTQIEKLARSVRDRGLGPTLDLARKNIAYELRWYLDRRFDRMHGTETSDRIELAQLDVVGGNRDQGVYYEPTSTRMLRFSVRLQRLRLGQKQHAADGVRPPVPIDHRGRVLQGTARDRAAQLRGLPGAGVSAATTCFRSMPMRPSAIRRGRSARLRLHSLPEEGDDAHAGEPRARGAPEWFPRRARLPEFAVFEPRRTVRPVRQPRRVSLAVRLHARVPAQVCRPFSWPSLPAQSSP